MKRLLVFLSATMLLAALLSGCCTSNCPISWQPSALAPVFYGVRDYGITEGAPGECRVFFPSLDGAVYSAPILSDCGRYPLILFAHGHCSEPEHYKKWFELPAQLARSGYVVVVPKLPSTAGGAYPWSANHSDLQLLTDTLAWMRNSWEHREVLLPTPATGIIGHSYGALLAARFAAGAGLSAYASLSGVWGDWPSTEPRPIDTLQNSGVPLPELFVWGTGTSTAELHAQLSGGTWNGLSQPKHQAVFTDAEHWDYLPAGSTTCEMGRGSCPIVAGLSRDIVTMFFAKYLPPERWASLRTQVPDSLIPPPLTLTTEQQFYAGGHLSSVSSIGSRPGCSMALRWVTPASGVGSSSLP